MKPFLFFVVALIATVPGFAQNGYGSTGVYDRTTNLPKDKHFFVIPPGAFWYKQPWRDSIYLYPRFQQGRLELMNGVSPSHPLMLNFNFFLGLMELAQMNGDIGVLDVSNGVKYVWIGDHKFAYTTPTYGFMEVILEGKAAVAELTKMRAILELSNGTKFPLSVSDIRTGVAKSTRYYWMEKEYFILDSKSHPHLPSVTVLARFYPRQKRKIKSFAKGHQTNFKKGEDLVEIVTWCNNELSGL